VTIKAEPEVEQKILEDIEKFSQRRPLDEGMKFLR